MMLPLFVCISPYPEKGSSKVESVKTVATNL